MLLFVSSFLGSSAKTFDRGMWNRFYGRPSPKSSGIIDAASRLLNLADVLRENQAHYRFLPAHHEIVHGSVEATEVVFWM